MNAENKGLPDKRIVQLTTIPTSTLARWKTLDKDDYRFMIYNMLKKADESFLINNFDKDNIILKNEIMESNN